MICATHNIANDNDVTVTFIMDSCVTTGCLWLLLLLLCLQLTK